MTRTLFVGPLPGWFSKEDVAEIFEKYGELHSIIVSFNLFSVIYFCKIKITNFILYYYQVSKKQKSRVNAFLKYTKRSSLEAAKLGTTDLTIENTQVKVSFILNLLGFFFFIYLSISSVFLLFFLSFFFLKKQVYISKTF